MEINSILRIIQKGKNFKGITQLIFEEVCRETLENLRTALEALDQVIMENRDKEKYRMVESRDRTIGLKIGDLSFKRRYYYEEKEIGGEKVKEYHYLLDEMLDIPAFKKVYPDLVYEGVANAGSMPYRQAAEEVGEEYPQSISHTTVWKKAKELGEKKAAEETAEKEAVYSEGKEIKSQGKQVKTLFAESDGVWVSLQGEDRKKHGKGKREKVEVKLFVSHEGWERKYSGSKEYKVKNKWCHAGIESSDEFWEKVSIGIAKRYDVSAIEHTALNGDGAPWIKNGFDYLPYVIYQLDKFHRNKALLKVYGNKKGVIGKIKEHIEKDDYKGMYKLIDSTYNDESDEKKKEKILNLKGYLKDNELGLKDYRKRGIDLGDIELRGMGIAEANVDKILANRIKKRGMSWSIKGLNSICKIVSMQTNGEFEAFCRHEFEGVDKKAKVQVSGAIIKKAKKLLNKKDAGKYERSVHMNIFDGPKKEWMNVLKGLVKCQDILKGS